MRTLLPADGGSGVLYAIGTIIVGLTSLITAVTALIRVLKDRRNNTGTQAGDNDA